MAISWTSFGQDVHLDWLPATGSRGLAEAIRRAIRSGRLAPDSAMPSTRALATDLGVARGTVTRVYADLAAEGYLRTSQGAPTRVATSGGTVASAPKPATPEGTARWDLTPGRPTLSVFPRAAWVSATRQVLQRTPAEQLGYPEAGGALALREALAGYLARTRGVLADPERIVVCGGFMHAAALVSAVLRDQGVSEIAFEDPSLFIFRDVVTEASGLPIVGVPVDDQGIAPGLLRSPAVVVTPAHQYPTGVPLAPGRRAELARWATETGAVVIEDDFDGEFRYDRQQVGALQALAPERVVYVGTTSKTLAPGLRIGWMVLPRAMVEPVRARMFATGWRPSTLDHLILAELISSGAYDKHVRRCRARYRDRRDALLAALPDYVTPTGISAGLQALLLLPEAGPTEDAVRAAARRNGVTFEVLGNHWINDGAHPQGIVVGYATPPVHAFAPAIRALRRTLDDAAR